MTDKQCRYAGCMVNADVPLYYDSRDDVIFAFSSEQKRVTIEVTPSSGWTWNRKDSGRNEPIKRIFQVQTNSSAPVPFGHSLYCGEQRSAPRFKVVPAYAFIEMPLFVGLDGVGHEPKEFEARIVVRSDVPVTIDMDSIVWNLFAGGLSSPRAKIVGVSKKTAVIKIAALRPSVLENGDSVTAKLSITLGSGLELDLKGTARFTIVRVDVKPNGKSAESTEDDPKNFLFEANASKKYNVDISVYPSTVKSPNDKVEISIKDNNLQLIHTAASVDKTRSDPICEGEYTISQLAGRYVLACNKPVEGCIRVKHIRSSAVDQFKFIVWSVDFVTPKGSPVTHPKENGEGQNEFCYDDRAGQCKIDLCVGVVPAIAGLPITASYMRKNYPGVFSVTPVTDPNNVTTKWEESNAKGTAEWVNEKGRLLCRATAYYVKMPQRNSSFGAKTATFTYGGGAQKKRIKNNFEIFFPKYGVGHPEVDAEGKKIEGPNWFYYWRQGTVENLNDELICYGEFPEEPYKVACYSYKKRIDHRGMKLFDETMRFSNKAVQKSLGEYHLRWACRSMRPEEASSQITVGMKGLFGVAALASIVQHEFRHMAIAHDLQDNGYDDEDNDGVRTTTGLTENLFQYVTDARNSDTYSFADDPGLPAEVAEEYSHFGDDEIRARAAEKDSGYNVHTDWAWPGCNTRMKYGPRRCDFIFEGNESQRDEESYGK